MHGRVEEDGDRPEEWIASTVRARVDGSPGRAEGLSIVEGTDILFETLVRQRQHDLLGARADFGVLVKLIDSSIRLSAQVHPDKAFARERFGSRSGKTEMWIVLSVRLGANLFIGFRENVTRETVGAAIDASEADRSALVSLLNEAPARPGDAWLIPGRLAHAIGAGCLILEVQEPTDLTFRPEAWSGQKRLSEFERYAGLGREAALDCFDFEGPSGARALAVSLQKASAFPAGSNGCIAERIIDRRVFPDFGVNRYRFVPGSQRELIEKPSIIVVTGGSGTVTWEKGSRHLAMGDYFFLPFAVCPLSVQAGSDLELIECLPPD
jgi:mannose-6-phosphate isomerase